jgi:hypothetical protein
MRRTMAIEISRTDLAEYEPVGTVEMVLSRIGHGDFHGSIDEVARAAAGVGGDHFWVADSGGDRIVAVVCRRRSRSRRGRSK